MIKYLYARLLFVCLFLIGIQSYGQNSPKADTSVIRMLIDSASYFNVEKIDPYAAIKFGEKAVALASIHDDSSSMAEAEFEIAHAYFTMRDIDKAKHHALRSDQASTKFNSGVSRIAILGLLANIYNLEGSYENSLKLHEEVLQIAEEQGDEQRLSTIRVNMSTALWEMGDYERSMKLMYQSMEYSEKNGVDRQLAVSYNNIGDRYRKHFEDYERAMEYFSKAVLINKKAGDWRALRMNYGNMALTMLSQNQNDSAQVLLDICEQLEENGVDIGGRAHRLNNQGSLYLHMSKFKEARKSFQEVKELCQEAGIMVGVFHANIGLGAVADSLGAYYLGGLYFDSAAMLADISGSPEFQSIAFRNLYDHYKLTGNHRAALTSLEKYQELKDTLTEEKSERQLASLKIGYETAIKEKENERLIADGEIKEAKIVYQLRVQIATFIIIALLLLLAGLMYRSSVLRHRAYNIVKDQKKELERKNAAMAEMDRMKNTIFSVIAHDLRGPVANVKGMLDVIEMGRISHEEQMKITQSLKKDVKQTLTTMENLLMWAKGQMDGTPPNPTYFELNEVAEDCVNLLSIDAKNKSIRIKLDKNKSMVFADEEQVRSIVRNLLSNAIKFSSPNELIKVKVYSEADVAKIEVEDNGVGFSEKVLENIHNASFAYSTRGTKGESGTGIGLQVVQDFVIRNNGNFNVIPKDEGGSIVSVSLPKKAA